MSVAHHANYCAITDESERENEMLPAVLQLLSAVAIAVRLLSSRFIAVGWTIAGALTLIIYFVASAQVFDYCHDGKGNNLLLLKRSQTCVHT